MKNIIFIHGANATCRSFNFIVTALRQTLYETEFHFFNYNHRNGFDSNYKKMLKSIDELEGDCMIVAHSMGGIYAMHLYNDRKDKITNVVSLATPFGGVTSALFLRWIFPLSRLLADSSPFSYPIAKLNRIKVDIPWTQIVTTSGDQPWVSLLCRNDGVVTRQSMRARKDISYVQSHSNHYEVLSDQSTIDTIMNSIWR